MALNCYISIGINNIEKKIAPTFFLIAAYQILKNYAILMNYKSLFQEKHSLQLNHLQFSKMDKLLSNSAICL